MPNRGQEEPVGVLQRFEKRLENLVEGAFAKVFKGVVHPVEIASAMQREADAHKSILGGGRTLVPNRYIIDLSPSDHDRLAQYAAPLAQELAQAQAEYIGEQGWTVYGDVIVEIERGDGLDTGMFRIAAEVYTGGVEPAHNPNPYQNPPPQGYNMPPQGGGLPPVSGPPGYGNPVSGPPGYGNPVSGPPGPQGGYGARQARLITSDGRQFTIVIGSTVIGRGEGAQVRLADVGISRQHARVDFDGSRVVLTDLSSTNGTTVNGNRINAAALQHGDVVQLGTTSLTFRLDG
ncbi:FhaA domain-containing protein [Cryptosporangium sp. NPDC048952]|uniref:FhaA domain-containing protein n=1 Tax=Cryptosporangium sp. NPDC048952 TaxID=3363961 RepID=UPI003724B5F6